MAVLATRYGISLKSIFNAANHANERQTSHANASRSRVLGIRVSAADLRDFGAAHSQLGIAHRGSNAVWGRILP